MSQTVTMTLTEFLLQRIAEDEALATDAMADRFDAGADGHWEMVEYEYEGCWPQKRGSLSEASIGRGYDPDQPWTRLVNRYDPARVLAECEAKRRIVAMIEQCDPDSGDMDCYVLHKTGKFLATVYADHPDYQEAWKP